MIASLRNHIQKLLDIWHRIRNLQCRTVVRWIASIDNARADHLSRLRDRDDWRLNPVIFQQIVERFGKPQVDLFATRNNAQVKHFFSRFVDEDALGTDALAQYWLQDLVYGNPPWG